MEPIDIEVLPPRCGSLEETRTWTTTVLGPSWEAYASALCESYGMIGGIYLAEMNRMMREYLPCAELDGDARQDLLRYMIGKHTDVELGNNLLVDRDDYKIWVPSGTFKFGGILGDVFELEFRVESLGSLPKTGDADSGYVLMASFPKTWKLGEGQDQTTDPFDSERNLVELCYFDSLASMGSQPAPVGVMLTLGAMLSLEKPVRDILRRMLVLCENWSFEIGTTSEREIEEAIDAVAAYMRKRDRVARGLEEE